MPNAFNSTQYRTPLSSWDFQGCGTAGAPGAMERGPQPGFSQHKGCAQGKAERSTHPKFQQASDQFFEEPAAGA